MAIATTITPWQITTIAEGTEALISIDRPPERRQPNSSANATTAVAEPRASRPTTSPSKPKPEEKPLVR